MPPHHLTFLLLLTLTATVHAAAGQEEATCNAASQPDPATLRPDRLTVILSGYSERRLRRLRSIAASYASHPLVSSVLVLWSNPSTPDHLLLHFPTSVSLLRTPTSSLNSRFLPRAAIRTSAVAVADDDIEPDAVAISFAFTVWQSHPNSLVGFFARSHDLDLARRAWVYTAAQPGRYSMVLTKLVVLGVHLLHKYSCSPELEAPRRHVERQRNCEDILMNFVAAGETGAGPILVEAGNVRDWGDPRNDDAGEEEEDGVVKKVGLSSRGEMGHWNKRGECIGEFHRLLGRMPLRYSYGKVVEAAVREQGLCRKAGRLVRCDQE